MLSDLLLQATGNTEASVLAGLTSLTTIPDPEDCGSLPCMDYGTERNVALAGYGCEGYKGDQTSAFDCQVYPNEATDTGELGTDSSTSVASNHSGIDVLNLQQERDQLAAQNR